MTGKRSKSADFAPFAHAYAPRVSSSRYGYLFQAFEACPDLAKRWALTIIRFDLRPNNLPIFVEDKYRRMRNALHALAHISRIKQAIGIDDLMPGIGQKRIFDLALPVLFDLLYKVNAAFGRVNTYCK